MMTLLNDWGATWAEYFVPAILQNTMFLGLVFLALYLLRNASARVRAAVATVGIVKLVIPPFVPLHLGERVAEEAPAVQTLLFPFADTATATPAAATGGLTVVASLMIAWASIALARLGWVGLQTLQLTFAVRGACPVPDEYVPASITERGLSVWYAERVPMPMTLGPWPRRIYVPRAWGEWTAGNRNAVLRHEAAHIARRDGLACVAEIVGQALWFFHPLAVLLVRRLRVWREMACDDAAVAPSVSARLAYSSFLADLAETALVPTLATESASTLYRGESELLSRVSHQIREGTMKTVSKKRIALVLGVLLAAAIPLSMVLAEPAPPASPEKGEAPAPAAAPETMGATALPSAATDDDKKKKDEPAKADQAKKEKLIKKHAKGDAPPPPKGAHVVQLKGDAIFADGEEMPAKKFAYYMEKVASKSKKKPTIVIDTSGKTSMGQLHLVQKVLQKNDLNHVVYRGHEGKKMKMALPAKGMQKKLAELPEGQVLPVFINCDGIAKVNGKQTKCTNVGWAVAKAMEKEPNLVVALHTEKDTSYGDFVTVLEGLKKAGCEKIAIQDPGT
ncbi:MAG: hypothetical protein GY838_17175 [bacterium]|nr:hypothetical protein [bacterium]